MMQKAASESYPLESKIVQPPEECYVCGLLTEKYEGSECLKIWNQFWRQCMIENMYHDWICRGPNTWIK